MSTAQRQIQGDHNTSRQSEIRRVSGIVQKVLQSTTLSEMSRAFGFVYSESGREVPDEDEAISGETANEYFELATADPHRYESFCTHLINTAQLNNVSDIKVIVDVGCGTGVLTSELARLFPAARVYGFDLSNDMIELANRFRLSLSDDVKERLAFEQGSIYNIESLMRAWGIKAADLTLSRHAFHRLNNPQLALRKALQATKRGGLLYVITFYGDLKSNAIRNQLVENVKQRIIGPGGKAYLNFAKCYLSAALRAPLESRYNELFKVICEELEPQSSSIDFSSRDCDCEITIGR